MMQSGIFGTVVSVTVFSLLMAAAISNPAWGQNDSLEATVDSQYDVDLHAAALWMLDQPEPLRQAAGLLMHQKTGSNSSSETDNPEALIAQIEKLLDQSKDPLNLALLAAVCHQAGIHGSCLDLGLAEAIIEHDQGNAISLASLFPDASDKFKEALLSSQTVDDYLYPIAEIWDRALEDYLNVGTETDLHMVASFEAMAIVMAVSIPGYQRLSVVCKNEVGESVLAMACDRISELANHSSNSLILRMVGLAIARERAIAAANQALAEQLDSERKHLQSLVTCIHQEVPESHWRESSEVTSNWIRSASKLGEVGATEALGEHYNVDCPDHFS